MEADRSQFNIAIGHLPELLLYHLFVAELKKELWRYRENWAFFMVTGSLYAISYTAISSSFHQFMTNPTKMELNVANRSVSLANELSAQHLILAYYLQ